VLLNPTLSRFTLSELDLLMVLVPSQSPTNNEGHIPASPTGGDYRAEPGTGPSGPVDTQESRVWPIATPAPQPAQKAVYPGPRGRM